MYGMRATCFARVETAPVLEVTDKRKRLSFTAAILAKDGEPADPVLVTVRSDEAPMLYQFLAKGDEVQLQGRLHLTARALDAWIVIRAPKQPSELDDWDSPAEVTTSRPLTTTGPSALAAITELLKAGSKTRAEIDAGLAEYKPKTLEQALTRGRQSGALSLADGRWSLAASRQAPEASSQPGIKPAGRAQRLAGFMTLPEATRHCGLALSSLQQAARIGRLRTEMPSSRVYLTTAQWLAEYLDSRPERFRQQASER